MYVTGYTLDQNFPTTQGAFQTTCTHCGTSGANQAAFVSKISAVSPVGQAPLITSSNAATFQVGVAGSFTVTTTGTPTPALSESVTLPGGLTFADKGNGTGSLSGTPQPVQPGTTSSRSRPATA